MSKTCYEELIENLVKNPSKKIFCEDYHEFEERGHSRQEIGSWIDYARMSLFIVKQGGSLNQKKAFARALVNYFKDKSETTAQALLAAAQPLDLQLELNDMPEVLCAIRGREIPNYHLFPEEIHTILEAEELGRGQRGEILTYEDTYGNKTVQSVDYREIKANIGERKDIFVIFSGHQQSGCKGAEAIYRYIKRNDQLPEGVIFLGLEDNQDLTEFNDNFKIRQKSEYQMYYNELKELGIPKEFLEKMTMVPTDTDTFQNIGLLLNTLKKYNVDNVNLYFVSYPVYQLRVASEFAFGITAAKDAPNCHLFIADITPKRFISFEAAQIARLCGDITQKELNALDFDDFRILSYDKPDMQLFDLSLANCIAHLYREHGKTRYAIPNLTEYPEKFKALAPLALGYSYPNVVYELCRTNETVACILKIMRTLMLDAHDCGLSGAEQDIQQQWYVDQTAKKLISLGLVTKKIIRSGYNMNEDEFFLELW